MQQPSAPSAWPFKQDHRRRSPRATRVRFRLGGAVAGMISVAVPPFLVAVLTVQINRDIGFGTTWLGVGVAGYFLVSAAFSPLMGKLAQLHGAILQLRLSCLGVTVGLIFIASAEEAWEIVVALCFLGLPNAAAQPAATHVITGIAPARTRATSFGLVQAAIPATALIAGLVLAGFQQASWRSAVLVVAGLTVLAQVAVHGVGADHRLLATGTPSSTKPSEEPGIATSRSRRFVGLMVAGGFALSFASMCLPTYLVITGVGTGLTPSSVATVQVFASLASIAMRILVAARGARASGAANVLGVVGLTAAGAIGFTLLAVGTQKTFVAGAMLAYAFGWGWSGLFNFSVTRAQPGRAAAAAGMTQGGIFLGACLGPLAFAGAAQTVGPQAAWLGPGVAAVIAAACIAGARRQWTLPVVSTPTPGGPRGWNPGI